MYREKLGTDSCKEVLVNTLVYSVIIIHHASTWGSAKIVKLLQERAKGNNVRNFVFKELQVINNRFDDFQQLFEYFCLNCAPFSD